MLEGIRLDAVTGMAAVGCVVLFGLIAVILVAARKGRLPRSGRGRQSHGSSGYGGGYYGDGGGGDSGGGGGGGGSSGGGDGGGGGGSY